MDRSQTQLLVRKERISIKFDKNILIRNKIPDIFDVDTTPPKSKTFRVQTIDVSVQRSTTIHCSPQSDSLGVHSKNR